jgi:hypothetical protein
MHKKADAERSIRHLALEWMSETGYEQKPGHYPSFGAFATWLEAKHFGHYLNFRSSVDARFEAEGCFESEIRNYWRWLASAREAWPRSPRFAVIKNSRSQSVRNESAGPADNGRGVTTSATGRRPSFLLLLLVEGCIERLGGIGEFLSVV